MASKVIGFLELLFEIVNTRKHMATPLCPFVVFPGLSLHYCYQLSHQREHEVRDERY